MQRPPQREKGGAKGKATPTMNSKEFRVTSSVFEGKWKYNLKMRGMVEVQWGLDLRT